MTNRFFLTRASFIEESLSLDELEEAVHRLSGIINIINEKEGNRAYVCNEIWDHWIWQGHSINEIWDPQCNLERDLKMRIQRLFEKTESGDISLTKLGLSDDGTFNGLLTLNIRAEYDDIWQINGLTHTWHDFCLNVIRYSTLSSRTFLDDCKILFDNIKFLDRNYDTIEKIYDDFKNKILHHLNGLNIHLQTAKKDAKNRTDILLKLSSLGNFDETASLEGDASRKDAFTFIVDDHGTKVCCEPHIKLCKSDNTGDSTYYFHRIYFHEGKSTLFNGRIIVGHIGIHL